MPRLSVHTLLLAVLLGGIAGVASRQFAAAESGVRRIDAATNLRSGSNDHGTRTAPVSTGDELSPEMRERLRQQIDRMFREAESAFGKRELEEADRLLRAVLSVDPDHARAASMLRALYKSYGAKLPVDEEAIENVTAALGDGFVRYESRNFVILSDCDDRWTRERMILLEATYRELFRTMERIGLQMIPPRHKLVCILIDEHGRYERFAAEHDRVRAPWVAGYYATLPNHVVMYNDATGPTFARADRELAELDLQAAHAESLALEARRARDRDAAEMLGDRADAIAHHAAMERARVELAISEAADRKAVHEAVHLVAFNCNLQLRSRQYPFWITEGIATNFETTNYRKTFGPSEDNDRRLLTFDDHRDAERLLPLEELIALNEISSASAERADVVYAQTYAFFRYAYRYHQHELAQYLRDLRAEPAGEVTPERHREMFTARFGDPAVVERVWLRRERARAR
jgi:hypothetical protein